jgi:Hsp70 protein
MNATGAPDDARDEPTPRQDAWTLAVDLGCARMTAAITTGSGVAEPLEFDGAPAMPGGVWMDSDGLFVTGTAATRQAMLAPQRWEPAPIRLLDHGSDHQLGGAPFEPLDAVAQVLTLALSAARERLGRTPERSVLICPQAWPETRQNALAEAGRRAGLNGVHVMGAAQAAGQYLVGAGLLAVGNTVAVLDVGAGSVSTAVIRRTGDDLEVLAADWADGIGGNSLDQAIFTRVVRSVLALRDPRLEAPLLDPPDAGWRRLRQALMREVRRAREELTRYGAVRVHTDAVADASLELTRHDLDVLIRPQIDQMVAQVRTTLVSAGASPESLAGLALLGGVGATPLLARAIVASLGQLPRVVPEPQLALALGGVTLFPVAVPHPVAAGHSALPPRGTASSPVAAAPVAVVGQRKTSDDSPATGLTVIPDDAEQDDAEQDDAELNLPVPEAIVVPDPQSLVPPYIAKRLAARPQPQPVTEPVTEPAAEPAPEPQAQPVTQPIARPAQPVAQPAPAVTGPAAQPAKPGALQLSKRSWALLLAVALVAVLIVVLVAVLSPSGSAGQQSAAPRPRATPGVTAGVTADPGARWAAWGTDADLARTWSAIVPLAPGQAGSRKQRCQSATVDSPLATRKIVCTYPNDVELTLLQYATPADRDARVGQIAQARGVERSAVTLTDLEGDEVTGALYTQDDQSRRWWALDGPGGGERRSLVYTRWPDHSADELATWWEKYAPFT